MKSTITIIVLLLCSNIVFSQETNNGKQLWAKSFLNQKAPALTVEEWVSEKPDTQGKFILIDFWATWCGPCRNVIPELNKLQQQFKDDLIIIGISDQTIEKVKAMTTPIIEYYHAIDTKATLKKTLEVTGIPHVILIDPKGIVRWEGFPLLNDYELTPEVVKNLIKKYK
ncbi:MAG: TlpA disulfide reductase family protein [Odoribacter sp.]